MGIYPHNPWVRPFVQFLIRRPMRSTTKSHLQCAATACGISASGQTYFTVALQSLGNICTMFVYGEKNKYRQQNDFIYYTFCNYLTLVIIHIQSLKG